MGFFNKLFNKHDNILTSVVGPIKKCEIVDSEGDLVKYYYSSIYHKPNYVVVMVSGHKSDQVNSMVCEIQNHRANTNTNPRLWYASAQRLVDELETATYYAELTDLERDFLMSWAYDVVNHNSRIGFSSQDIGYC